jgi:hypothetical protein
LDESQHSDGVIETLANTEALMQGKRYGDEQRFWIYANMAEAYFGLGNVDGYKEALKKAKALDHQAWMIEGFNEQVARLSKLLGKYGKLMNPKWLKVAAGPRESIEGKGLKRRLRT